MVATNQRNNELKRTAIQGVAGSCAGFIEVVLMQPLDIIKTRLQMQASSTIAKSSDPHLYSGLFDCMRKMYRHEGVASFWKGIVPLALTETPRKGLKFIMFEQFKSLFMFGSSTPTLLTYTLAGLSTGSVEGALVNSFEVVKVTLQTNKSTTQMPSSWAVTKLIVKEKGVGLKGLNKGLTATVLRNGSYHMVWFGFYHRVKDYVPEYEDPLLEFGRKFAIAFTSSVISSFFSTPFDVAKTLIQAPQPKPGVVKYSSTRSTIQTVYKEEGFKALYKGMVPKLMRLGPGGAIVLVFYEYLYDFLESNIQP